MERQPIAKMEPTQNRLSCQQKNRKNFKASYPAEKMRERPGGKRPLAQSRDAALQNISHDIQPVDFPWRHDGMNVSIL